VVIGSIVSASSSSASATSQTPHVTLHFLAMYLEFGCPKQNSLVSTQFMTLRPMKSTGTWSAASSSQGPEAAELLDELLDELLTCFKRKGVQVPQVIGHLALM